MSTEESSTSGFPIVDRPEHQPGVTMPTVVTPGEDVPKLRAEARASFGDPTAPMIEIDPSGRIVYVAGDWHDLTGHTRPGQLAFPVLMQGAADAEAVRAAIVETLQGRRGAVFDHDSALGARRLRVVPIPSPHVAGRTHALVGLGGAEHVPGALPVSMARHVVRADDMEALRARRAAEARSAEAAHVETEQGVVDAGSLDRGMRLHSPTDEPAGSPEPAGDTDAATSWWAHGDHPSNGDRRRRQAVAPVLAGPSLGVTIAEADAERDRLANTGATASRASSPGRAMLLTGSIVALLYVAFQGLFLGPNHGWWSPLDALFDRRSCLISSPCDAGVARLNHLGVIALVAGLALLVVHFRRSGADQVTTRRPALAGDYTPDRWRPSASIATKFAWAAIAAVAIVALQTIAGAAPSIWPWFAAIGFGGVAAWCADRDAGRPLGATMAALTYAPGLLLLLVGLGGLWLGDRRLVAAALVVVGVGALAWSARLFAAGRSSFDQIDLVAMTGFALLAFVLAMLRHGSWRYAFVGDEWGFFFTALDDVRGGDILGTFEVGGPNDYFIGLTYEAQAATMRLVGDDVFGWRFASLLPLMLSVPAMYAVARWLIGRPAAIVTAVVLASGHVLLSFSMVPYNNTQALVAVSWTLAALAWAHQRPGALRFFVLGAVAGTTFLVYALARLGLVPAGLLFVVAFRSELRAFMRRVSWTVLGGFCVAAPTLFSLENWQALLKATPVEAEADVRENGVLGQLFDNVVEGLLLFIGRSPESHYVSGPHLDLASAVLLVVGVAWLLVRARRDAVVRWFLIGSMTWWVLTSAIQQYSTLSTTRSFMLPLIYCVLAGAGFHALATIAGRRRERTRAATAHVDPGPAAQPFAEPAAVPLSGPVGADVSMGTGEFAADVDVVEEAEPEPTRRAAMTRPMVGALAVLVVGVVALNQWHISGHANDRQALTEQAMLVGEFQATASVDGDGMDVHVAWAEGSTQRIVTILRSHGVAPERIMTTPIDGALDVERLCETTEPTLVSLDNDHPRRAEWQDALASCWGAAGVPITNPQGAVRLIRMTNAAGAAEFALDPTDRFRRGVGGAGYQVRDVVDVAIDGDGVAYGLVRTASSASIHRLDGGGSFRLAQPTAFDFDITNAGHFVVAASRGDDRLAWYDGAGDVVATFRGHDELPMIGGVTVDGDLIWFGDPARGQATSVAPNAGRLELVDERSAGQTLGEVASVAVAGDGAVWAHDSTTGRVVRLDRDDELTAEVAAPTSQPVDAPRLTSTSDGNLVQVITESSAVRLIDGQGRVVDERGGVAHPVAVALRDGEFVAADRRWHEQPVLVVDESWRPPAGRGVVAWGAASPLAGGYVEFAGPYGAAPVLPATAAVAAVPAGQAIETASGQSWQRLGADRLTAVHAIDSRGDLTAVADTAGHVLFLDREANIVEAVSVGEPTTFVSDLAIDDTGAVWVLDAGIGQLIRLAPDASPSTIRPDNAALGNARGLSAAPDGGVWVASTAAAALTRLDGEGEFVRRIETPGRQPTDVVEVADGSLWLVDGERFELVQLDSDGSERTAIALEGFSSVESPHLAVDTVLDLLWLSGPETSTVQPIDLTSQRFVGDPIAFVRPDATRLDKAIGIAVDETGAVWTVDSNAGATATLDPVG